MGKQDKITTQGSESSIAAAIARFAAMGFIAGNVEPRAIPRAILEDGPRKVVMLAGPDGTYAFKYNPDAAKSGEFTKEAQRLARMARYLQDTPDYCVIDVVWVDPMGEAIASRFDPSPTARDALSAAETETERRAVFERGGRWLGALHRATEKKTDRIDLDWIESHVAKLRHHKSTAVRPHAAPALLDRMTGVILEDAAALKGVEVPAVHGHGDFHGGNLLFAADRTIALDCTAGRRSNPLFDIADYLIDLDLRCNPEADEIGDSGIDETHLEAFLKGYGPTVERDVLDRAIRISMFLKFCKITLLAFAGDPVVRRRFLAQQNRLTHVLLPSENVTGSKPFSPIRPSRMRSPNAP